MSKPFIPTQLKMIKGTARTDRIKDEPEPDLCIPSPPEHLNQIASVEWGRVSQQLYKLGLLSDLDRSVLAGYCVFYARWVKAEQELAKTNEILMTKKSDAGAGGNIIHNPWVSIARDAYIQMCKSAQEFGMTPSSRARVSARKAEGEKKDGFSQFKKKG